MKHYTAKNVSQLFAKLRADGKTGMVKFGKSNGQWEALA